MDQDGGVSAVDLNEQGSAAAIESPPQPKTFRAQFTDMSPRRRLVTVASAVLALVVIIVIAGLTAAYKYQPLFVGYQGQYGSYVVASNGSPARHTTTQVAAPLTPTLSGPVTEYMWKEPKGTFTVEVIVTINNVHSLPVAIDGFAPFVSGASTGNLHAYFYKSGSLGSQGGTRFHSFTLGGHANRVIVVDYTQHCVPSTQGQSNSPVGYLPVHYRFFGFNHTVNIPIQPYVMVSPLSC
jgi:hypothetical protein